VTVGAIVLATAADRRSGTLARLTAQLGTLGVAPVRVVSPNADQTRAALLASSEQPVLVVDAGIVTHAQALAALAADARLHAAVLTGGGASLGVLRIDATDRSTVAAAMPPGRTTAAEVEAAARSAGITLTAVDIRRMFWARPAEADVTATIDAADALDEDRLWLDSAVKADDGFFGTFFVSPYSRFIARWAARRGIRPNAVTVLALLLALGAAVLFALGHRWDRVAGAGVLFAAFVLDCVDGQLARYTRGFTPFGAWLDVTTDRVKEYAVYAGLAVGASRVADVDLWTLAATAMCLQTVRHLLDHTFPTRLGGSRGVVRRPWWSHWPRKLALLPIGERFAVICVTAAVWTPRATFLVLLTWGGLAVLYGNAGRVMRS
jgi:phosphatidylglycerophosphate synthase